MPGYPFTSKHHADTYPSIDPTLPALSAAGKTILITGGASGIGKATALAFGAAGARRIIIIARSTSTLAEAKADLNTTFPSTIVETYSADISSASDIDSSFESARNAGEIHVVVLSAAYSPPFGDSLALKDEDIRKSISINFNGNLNVVRAFLSTGDLGQKTIINISTAVVHLVVPTMSTYASSKLLWTHYLQHTHEEQKAKGLTVFQIHPGTIYTDLAVSVGLTKSSRQWDKVALPANFNVWLASPEAKFLSGKFLWAAWDVHELKARKEEILSNPALLTLGLQVK